jgi:hypothetical protein
MKDYYTSHGHVPYYIGTNVNRSSLGGYGNWKWQSYKNISLQNWVIENRIECNIPTYNKWGKRDRIFLTATTTNYKLANKENKQ